MGLCKSPSKRLSKALHMQVKGRLLIIWGPCLTFWSGCPSVKAPELLSHPCVLSKLLPFWPICLLNVQFCPCSLISQWTDSFGQSSAYQPSWFLKAWIGAVSVCGKRSCQASGMLCICPHRASNVMVWVNATLAGASLVPRGNACPSEYIRGTYSGLGESV